MKQEHPILFTGEMVRAILDGRKTMTRRVIKIKDGDYFNTHRIQCGDMSGVEDLPPGPAWGFTSEQASYKCPFGVPGDKLWVRETWVKNPNPFPIEKIKYRATSPAVPVKWKPSIHMPKKFTRIWLEVVSVKVERVQEITDADAINEGVGHGFQMNSGWPDYLHIKNGVCELTQDTAKMSFATLWDSINAHRKGCLWQDDPFVWVVSFKKLEG